MKRLLPFLATILLIPCMVSGQEDPYWSLLGPGHANWVEALTVDQNGHLYIASDIGGMYKSVDQGNTYFPISEGITNYHLYEIVVNPEDSDMVFAGGRGGIYKSTDAGMTWEAKRDGIGDPRRYGYRAPISAIAIDPLSPNIVYAGVGLARAGSWDSASNHGTVFKSTDYGETWSKVNTGSSNIPGDDMVLELVIDYSDTDTIYAGTNSGIYKSTDGGTNWYSKSQGLPSGRKHFIVMDPQNPQTLYATVQYDVVYISENGAESWSDFSTGLPTGGENYDWLAIDPSGDTVYVAGSTYSGSTSGVWKRSRSGGSWEKLTEWGDGGNMVHGWYGTTVKTTSMAVDYTNTNRIYFSGSTTLYKTENKGSAWEQIYTTENGGGYSHRGINMFGGCMAIAVDPNDPDKLYVDSGDHGLFRSHDSGVIWHQANDGMRHHSHIFDIIIDPVSSTVYVTDCERSDSGGGGVAKSTDYGVSWIQINSGLPDRTVYSLIMDTSSAVDNRLLFAGTSGGVYRSTNGGTSWSSANSGISGTVKSFGTSPGNPSIIWAVADGVFRTDNGGSSWQKINQDDLRQVNDITINPANQNTMYIATRREYDSVEGRTYDAGVYKSTDGGQTWELKLYDPEWVSSVALNPDNPSVIYATSMTNNYYDEASGKGLFMSADSGETWTEIHNNMPVLRYETLILDPTDPSRVYVGVLGSGYYVNQGTALPICESLNGDPCAEGQTCEDGSFHASSDYGNLCCVGGVCQDPPQAQTCTDLGYSCCSSCVTGTEHPENDTDCPGQYCCGECDTSGQVLSFRTTQAVAIDGDPSEWTNMLGFDLPYTSWVSVSAEPPGNTQDCSAVFRSMWDDGNIYVLVKVTDDSIYHDSDRPHLDDSTELYLDGGHEQAGSYDSNDFQLTVDTNNDFRGVRSDQLTFEHAVTSAADSYVIEYAVPFSALEATPEDGLVMGFDMAVNDDDDGGDTRESQIVWHGDGTGWQDPGQFGEIMLKVSHRSDTSPQDGCINMQELTAFIDSWKYDSTATPMWEMMEAVVMYYSPGAWCP